MCVLVCMYPIVLCCFSLASPLVIFIFVLELDEVGIGLMIFMSGMGLWQCLQLLLEL